MTARRTLDGLGAALDAALADLGRVRELNDAFWRWFGASKVVDAQGRPLVVYKAMNPRDWTKEQGKDFYGRPTGPGLPPGTGPLVESISRPEEFPAFDVVEGQWTGIRLAGFFTSSRDVVNEFAQLVPGYTVFPCYLSLQNPIILDAKGKPAGGLQFGSTGKAFRDAFRYRTHDGAILLNTSDEGDVYVAARPEQIKSVFNRGTWDASSPKLLDGLSGALVEALDLLGRCR